MKLPQIKVTKKGRKYFTVAGKKIFINASMSKKQISSIYRLLLKAAPRMKVKKGIVNTNTNLILTTPTRSLPPQKSVQFNPAPIIIRENANDDKLNQLSNQLNNLQQSKLSSQQANQIQQISDFINLLQQNRGQQNVHHNVHQNPRSPANLFRYPDKDVLFPPSSHAYFSEIDHDYHADTEKRSGNESDEEEMKIPVVREEMKIPVEREDVIKKEIDDGKHDDIQIQVKKEEIFPAFAPPPPRQRKRGRPKIIKEEKNTAVVPDVSNPPTQVAVPEKKITSINIAGVNFEILRDMVDVLRNRDTVEE